MRSRRALDLLFLGFVVCNSIPMARAAALESLVIAEYAFDAAAQRDGVAPAFLAFLADDAVLFRPLPVDGPAWWSDHPDFPGKLTWYPAFADVAEAGDLGYTTGPWTFTPSAEGRSPTHGHYVTVWRRETDGPWRAVIDAGHSHAALDPAPPALPRAIVAGLRTVPAVDDTTRAARESLIDADAALGEAAARDGFAAALLAGGTPGLRVCREGHPPAVGPSQAKALLERVPFGTDPWTPQGGAASVRGEFGYTYGTVGQPAGKPTHAYLRVWKREAQTWRVMLDLLQPAE